MDFYGFLWTAVLEFRDVPSPALLQPKATLDALHDAAHAALSPGPDEEIGTGFL